MPFWSVNVVFSLKMALEATEVPHHVEYLRFLLFMLFCRAESEIDLENGTIPNSTTIPILQLNVQVIIKSCLLFEDYNSLK